MRKTPEVLKSEIIAQTRFFRVEQRDLRFANGTEVCYERLVGSSAGAVLIVPLLDDDTVLLIREYAAGVHRYELALPKGKIEANEPPLEAANREIMEEIGYGAHHLEHLTTLTIAPGYQSHATHIVLARDLYAERHEGDEPEEIDVVPWPLARLDELVSHPECSEARSIAALFLAREHLSKQNETPSMNDTTQALIEDPSRLLPQIIELATDAGERILKVYETDFDVTHKSDESPLTAADMAAHNAILAGLAILTPDLPVLSEESVNIPFEERKKWSTYWLVDPLDGTREFVKRNGEFTVNIALIHEHEPILGVIYTPVSGLTYYAARGHGAWKRIGDGPAERIHTRKKTPGRTVVAGSRSHRGDSLNAFLKNLGEYDIISMGSSLKSCLVAEGKADIYPRLGPTSEWDTGAAQCIVEEAGGRVIQLDGTPLRYNTKDSLLNPHFLVVGDPDYDWTRFL